MDPDCVFRERLKGFVSEDMCTTLGAEVPQMPFRSPELLGQGQPIAWGAILYTLTCPRNFSSV